MISYPSIGAFRGFVKNTSKAYNKIKTFINKALDNNTKRDYKEVINGNT
jgi:hypothetical protein